MVDWKENVRIAVIDDNIDNLGSLQFVLDAAFRNGNGYCLNQEELFAYCKKIHDSGNIIDLLFLDVMMGGTNGYEILKVVCQMYPDLIARVVIFTADKFVGDDTSQLAKASIGNNSETRVIGILHKPISPFAITNVLEEMWDKDL